MCMCMCVFKGGWGPPAVAAASATTSRASRNPPPFYATVLMEEPERGPGVLLVQVPGGCVSGNAALVRYKGNEMQVVVPPGDGEIEDSIDLGDDIFSIQWPF